MSDTGTATPQCDRRPTLTWRQGIILLPLLLLLGIPHYQWIPFSQPITQRSDLDAFMHLRGVQSDPSLRAALSWFVGDGPQRVHGFRPLRDLTLWVEYRLWGYTRWAYQIMNILYFAATALALIWLCRVIGMPMIPACYAGALMMFLPSSASVVVLEQITTRCDLLGALFGILAFGWLLRYLECGGRRRAAGFVVWSLLACLSKEIAPALVLIAVAAALLHWRSAPRRRILTSIALTLGVGLVWVVWYKFAESNMEIEPWPSHSFAGMWLLFQKRWPRALWRYGRSLCGPAGRIGLQIFSIRDWTILIYPYFLRDVIGLALFVVAVWLLWRERCRWLVLLCVWKVFAYLPVLPLLDIWPWYLYVPRVLDPILPVGAVWVLWHDRGVGERLSHWLARAGAATDRSRCCGRPMAD